MYTTQINVEHNMKDGVRKKNRNMQGGPQRLEIIAECRN